MKHRRLSRYYPGVNAGASYALNNTEISDLTQNKGLSWGLNLSWTLFDNFSNKPKRSNG